VVQPQRETGNFTTSTKLQTMKFLFTLFILSTVALVQAQSPVLDRSYYFDIGDSALLNNKFDTSLQSMSIGASGANAVWDFSNVDFNHPSVIVDTALFIDPTGTPFYPSFLSADYSASNICMRVLTDPTSPMYNDFHYYVVNDDSLAFIGHWADNPGTELWEDHCTDFIAELRFPLSYLSAYTDSFSRWFNDLSGSDWHQQTGTLTVEADGYGTLISPDGMSYPNALRVHLTYAYVDSSMFGLQSYSQSHYRWYATGVKGFIVQADMSLSNPNVVETASYQKQTNMSTGIQSTTQVNDLQLSPNPASDVVTLQRTDGLSIGLVDVCNALGQKVIVLNVASSHATVNISELPSGFYTVHMISKSCTACYKLLVR
jgi:hypothetical protein